jgi:phage shock protein C
VTTPDGSNVKVLRRSSDDKMIAGVAGGIARYLGIDPVIVRVIFLVLLFTGAGFLIYLIGWIAIPMERPDDNLGQEPEQAGNAAERDEP